MGGSFQSLNQESCNVIKMLDFQGVNAEKAPIQLQVSELMVSRATAERKTKPHEQDLQICPTARKGRKEGGKQQGSHFSP